MWITMNVHSRTYTLAALPDEFRLPTGFPLLIDFLDWINSLLDDLHIFLWINLRETTYIRKRIKSCAPQSTTNYLDVKENAQQTTSSS